LTDVIIFPRLFTKDRKPQDAVIRNLETIGEAAGNLPEQIQKGEPEIDWRKITGLRNILIHEYFGINDVSPSIIMI